MKEKVKGYLNAVNRTKDINFSIDLAFNKLKNQGFSDWGLQNGQDNYNIFVVSENYMLQHLINKYPTQKDFYVLDVGAGNFQFAKNQAKFINTQIAKKILPNDISVNFISIRGESNYGEKF